MKVSGNTLFSIIFTIACIASTSVIQAQQGFADRSLRQSIIESGDFIHIPGPNPILSPGPKGAWDDENIEAGDAFED